MNAIDTSTEDALFLRRAVEAAIRIAMLALLALWSFLIARPFIEPVLWGVIIAIAVYPAYAYLVGKLGGRRKLTATLLALSAIAALLVPAAKFFGGTIDATRDLAAQLETGALQVPPPSEKVATWPLIGKDVERIWGEASANLEGSLERYKPQLKAAGKWFLSLGTGLGLGVLQFTISIIIAGVFLAIAASGKAASLQVSERLVPGRGAAFTDMMEKTIRSVAVGVLGIAIIQSFLGGIAMIIVGVPAATLWALLILILAVVQLPPILILGPVAFYVFSTASTGTAVAFLIWAIFVSASDAFLKPLLLGRGVDVPMLVILLGAIGGMMMSGIIGLFLGAVILAISYQIFIAWLRDAPQQLPS